MLVFGVIKDDENHEAESLRAAAIIREVLSRHDVETHWGGTLNQRIAINAFEWQKRRYTAAPDS